MQSLEHIKGQGGGEELGKESGGSAPEERKTENATVTAWLHCHHRPLVY